MLLSEYTAPYLECKSEIAKVMDNLDLIPSFKVLLLHTYMYEEYPKWNELAEEWPNVTKILQDTVTEMFDKHNGDYALVEDALRSLLADYEDEVEGLK